MRMARLSNNLDQLRTKSKDWKEEKQNKNTTQYALDNNTNIYKQHK
jgi:hypothetical protein